MDASVNMKMTPDEHRLIVSALEEAKDNAADTHKQLGGPHRNPAEIVATAAEKRAAREREAQISFLLQKL